MCSYLRSDITLVAMALGMLFCSSIQADQLIVHNINYTGAKIIGLEQGRLRFQTADGRTMDVWIDEIELIMVDRGSAFADFNQAERFLASAEPTKSIVRYQRSMRLSEDFWVRLVSARMLMAMDRAGQLDKAVTMFIRIARAGETGKILAARLFPTTISTKHRGRLIRAVKQLEGELRRKQKLDPSQRVLFSLLLFDLLQRSDDDRATGAALDAITLPIPKPIRLDSIYSIMIRAVETVIRENKFTEALAGLDQAIQYCPKPQLPELLWHKGRVLEKSAHTRDLLIRASWPYLRIAIHFPDHPLAPKGLHHAAELLYRMGNQDKAVALLRECLQHKELDKKTRQLVENAIREWQPA